MATLMLPLSSFSHTPNVIMLSLPLWHQWKRELSLFTCCTWSHVDPFGDEITPSLCLRYSKVSLGRGLVKISPIYSFVPIYSNVMLFFVTCSLRKWNLIGICFVLECITRFLEMFITLMLSQSIGMGSSHFTYMSCNVCFIQRNWVKHVVATTYLASAMHNHTEDCFLLNQDTR